MKADELLGGTVGEQPWPGWRARKCRRDGRKLAETAQQGGKSLNEKCARRYVGSKVTGNSVGLGVDAKSFSSLFFRSILLRAFETVGQMDD